MQLTLTRPDDWHLHVRDGVAMHSVVGATAEHFARAIIMPNLKPPVTTVAQALSYRDAILAVLPKDSQFQPLMTLYLTERTTPEEIERLRDSESVVAVKYYPAGATTNSDAGVSDWRKVRHVLETMENCEVPLLIHGEVTNEEVDVFDREAVFIENILKPLLNILPRLKVVFEHITTRNAAEFVAAGEDRLGATITAHHLLMNRNALFQGGIRPHHYCLPVLKREQHREALIEAATGGSPRFFLGTDSAPHAAHTKENACGCAGMYTAPIAMGLYAEAFEQANALDRLEGFASFHGADFYGLPRNQDTIKLEKNAGLVPEYYPFGEDKLVPLRAGERLDWQVISS
ncbi:MAG: dihydroorotase [Pseudomonadota bacterium]